MSPLWTCRRHAARPHPSPARRWDVAFDRRHAAAQTRRGARTPVLETVTPHDTDACPTCLAICIVAPMPFRQRRTPAPPRGPHRSAASGATPTNQPGAPETMTRRPRPPQRPGATPANLPSAPETLARRPRPSRWDGLTPRGPRSLRLLGTALCRPSPSRPPDVMPCHPHRSPKVTSRSPSGSPDVAADHPHLPLQPKATSAQWRRSSLPRTPRRHPPPLGRPVSAAAVRRDAAPIPHRDDAYGGDGSPRVRRNSCATQSGHAWRSLPPP